MHSWVLLLILGGLLLTVQFKGRTHMRMLLLTLDGHTAYKNTRNVALYAIQKYAYAVVYGANKLLSVYFQATTILSSKMSRKVVHAK